MTPEDLRALIARRRLVLYKLAPRVGLNPARLGAMLNERVEMPAAVIARVAEAIEAAGR